MKTTPMLFSGPMVRALLEGRKTQTRRVINPQPPSDDNGTPYGGRILGPEMYSPVKIDQQGNEYDGAEIYGVYDEDGEWGVKCPYGQPGDWLWVREAFSTWDNVDGESGVDYRATPTCNVIDRGWRPSIFMPRWANRLTLEITDIRVERVQKISREDVIAEGLFPFGIGRNSEQGRQAAHEAFSYLWDRLNFKRGHGWDKNPWVWALTFRVHQCNVDQLLQRAA
jgi:hypothetical protein